MPAPEAPRHGSVLSYSHLSYQIPSRRSGPKYIKLVDDVSVEVRPGEMLAIMVSYSDLLLLSDSMTLSIGAVRCWYVTSVPLTAVVGSVFKR